MNRRAAYQKCRLRIRYWRAMNATDSPDTRFLRACAVKQRQMALMEYMRK